MTSYETGYVDPLYKAYSDRIENSKTLKSPWIRKNQSSSFQLVSDFLVCPVGYERSTIDPTWCIKTQLPTKRTGIADTNIKYMVDPLPEPVLRGGDYMVRTRYVNSPPSSMTTPTTNPYTGERHHYHLPKGGEGYKYSQTPFRDSYL